MPDVRDDPRLRGGRGFMYGTAWKESDTRRLVGLALAAGFRAIDTANQRKHYDEATVGLALADAYAAGSVRREDLFLQTKFTHVRGQDHRLPYDAAAPVATQVRQSFESSCAHLGTDMLDAYVLHGPSSRTALTDDDVAAWRAMEAIHATGAVSALGISNVTPGQVASLLALARVPPAVVQNRCYASMGWDREMRALCRNHGIAYQAFSLLTANRSELAHPTVRAIAARTGRTPQQVVFGFALAVGMIPLTGTTSRAHMDEDLAAARPIDDSDIRDLEALG